MHRLDRETSEILIFAKNEAAKFRLQSQWQDTKKKYLAVVHGKCEKRAETITTYLAENQAHGVYPTNDARKGKLAHTAYKVLKQTKDFSLLEVDLLTGWKHRIHISRPSDTGWSATQGTDQSEKSATAWHFMPARFLSHTLQRRAAKF